MKYTAAVLTEMKLPYIGLAPTSHRGVSHCYEVCSDSYGLLPDVVTAFMSSCLNLVL